MLSKHWMGASELQTPLVELIRYTSSGLGKDVLAALERARDREDPGSRAHATFALRLENVSRARADFPTVVTMDSHGGSLHAEMEAASAVEARALMEKNRHLGKLRPERPSPGG